MKHSSKTRVPLVIAFVVAFLGTLVIMSLHRSKEGVGILIYLPYILLGILGYTVHKRLQERGEKVSPGSVIISVFLLMIPLLNLFILADLLSNKKRGYSEEENANE